MKKNNRAGFTLVEVIVVAILLMVLALGGFSVFMMFVNEKREIAANFKLQRQSEALVDEISRRAREAHLILAGDEPADIKSTEAWQSVSERSVESVAFYHENVSEPFISFSITNDGVVQVRDVMRDGTGATLKNFTIDGEPIVLKTDGDNPSKFTLGKNRAFLTLDMTLQTEVSSHTYSLNIQRGAFLCRN